MHRPCADEAQTVEASSAVRGRGGAEAQHDAISAVHGHQRASPDVSATLSRDGDEGFAQHAAHAQHAPNTSSEASAADGGAENGDYAAHLFVFTADKAGMAAVDKERTNRIIYEMSKDSRFFRNAQRRDQQTDECVVP